jgi:hypothetical protein
MLKTLSQDALGDIKLIVNSEEFASFLAFLQELVAKLEKSVLQYDYQGGTDRELMLKIAQLDGYKKLFNEIESLKKNLKTE